MNPRVNDDLLDIALSRLAQGEPPAEVAAKFPAAAGELRPLLQVAATVAALRQVEMPAAEALVSDRNEFLAQVTELQLLPASPGPLVRFKGWISSKLWPSSTSPASKPEATRKMYALALKSALILTVAFGSLGGTLAVAADSLPDSPVYPLKLAMEQAQLTLKEGPAEKANMHLALAQERIQEMLRLAAKGEAPEEALLARTQTHMRAAYQLASQADDEQMQGLLVQAQTMTQASGQELAMAQEQAQEVVRERLQQAAGMMAQWQNEAQNGLDDPACFRHQYGPGGPCGGEDCEPPPGDGEGEQRQYGPGEPCQGQNCEPPQDGSGEQHQYGPAGPGETCQGQDCEPPQDGSGEQHQYGPAGPGEPCQGQDCEPPQDGSGEQHQYGPGGPGEPCQGQDCEPPQDGSGEQHQHGPGGSEPGG